MSVDTLPAGFRRNVDSGLILPEAHSRERIVWTRDEWKNVERAQRFLQAQGIVTFWRCEHSDVCKAQPIERRRAQDGGITIRCAHADRTVTNPAAPLTRAQVRQMERQQKQAKRAEMEAAV